MVYTNMKARVAETPGFLAALDQSGGSTRGALQLYGIPESAYSKEADMFALIHELRVRVMTAPAFSGDKVIGAILFERTMDAEIHGKPIPSYLWEDRRCVPFLKVDKGREAETDGVTLMRPIPQLDTLLDRAAALGVFGTKMRSTINLPCAGGITAVVKQQFEIGSHIAKRGLVPILEPEVLITSPDKPTAEAILRDALARHLDALPPDEQVMLKLTIPDVPDLYKDLIDHERVVRVVALSGGYTRVDACRRLARNHGMIASFSRAMLEELRYSMNDAAFNEALGKSIEEIYAASTVKV